MYAKINGARIFFDVEGSGYVPDGTRMVRKPACFVLHGGPGCDHTYFKPWVTPLSEHLQLVYVDHRGNGLSEEVDSATYTIEQMADDLEGLRKYLELGPVVVLGNSFGGMVALVYAIRYPQSVSKLILCTTTPSFEFWDDAQDMADTMATPEQKAVLPNLFEGRIKDDEELHEWWSICLPLYFHNKNQQIFDEMGGRMKNRLQVCNYMFANVIPKYDVREALPTLPVETLVIGARYDWVTPLSQAKLMHELIPTSRLVIFENSGHMPFIEEQDSFNELVIDFVTSVLDTTVASSVEA